MAVLTRRELLKTGGAAAVVLGVGAFRRPASAQPPPGAWNHDPASPIGPLHWGDIGFPTCGAGMNQSPVDIRTGQLAAYHGSLTTPGCTQGVIWSVLANGGHVSTAAVTRLHQLIAQFPFYHGYLNNNRPVQPLNGRVISSAAEASSERVGLARS